MLFPVHLVYRCFTFERGITETALVKKYTLKTHEHSHLPTLLARIFFLENRLYRQRFVISKIALLLKIIDVFTFLLSQK